MFLKSLFSGAAVLLLVLTLSQLSPVRASSANFILSSEGIKLGEAQEIVENDVEQPTRYNAKIEQGQIFTLLAQGWAYPRSPDPEVAKGSAFAPEAAEWRFDNEDFKLLVYDAMQADKTKSMLRLQAATPGLTRVRFSGQVLGYKRSFDILIDIVPAPKKIDE